MTTTRRNVIITDLDQSDNQQRGNDENHRKVHKKRSKEKTLQTLSGNFNRRSHSAEYSKEDRLGHGEKAGNKTTKPSSYFNELDEKNEGHCESLSDTFWFDDMDVTESFNCSFI